METTNKPPKKQVIVAYSADPWESALPVLRYIGPASQVGYKVIPGKQGLKIHPDIVADADIVLIQRDFPRFIDECRLVITNARRLKKPLVYEIDDLLFELPKSHLARHDLDNYLNAILWVAFEADLVTTSTPYLRDYLEPLNSQVRLLPNYLNDSLWTFRPPQQKPIDAPLVIGYMGGQTHYFDLAMITPVLLNLLQNYQGKVSLRFWGGNLPEELVGRPDVEHLPVEIQDYKEFARYFNNQTCDIFIAPLEDNRFNRSKSEIKFLAYSTLGVPGVYSHLPPYERIVEHGTNGFLASTTQEWGHWLVHLIENPSVRFEVAAAAQETVRRDWMLSDHAEKWLDAYQQPTIIADDRISERLERIDLFFRVASQAQQHILKLEKDSSQMPALQNEIKRLNNDIDTLRHAMDALRQSLQDKSIEAEILRAQLDDILQSRSWQFISRINHSRTKLKTMLRRENSANE